MKSPAVIKAPSHVSRQSIFASGRYLNIIAMSAVASANATTKSSALQKNAACSSRASRYVCSVPSTALMTSDTINRKPTLKTNANDKIRCLR